MRKGSVAVLVGLISTAATGVHAQVTSIEIVSREPAGNSQATGAAGPYEILRGRIHDRERK